MIKFKDVPYIRIDMEEYEKEYREKLSCFQKADTYEKAFYQLIHLDHVRKLYGNMAVICEIRNTMDVNNEFYRDEAGYYNQVQPRYEALESEMNAALHQCPFKEELQKQLGREMFDQASLKQEAFSQEIMKDLLQENELSSKYSEMVANLKGKTEEGEVPLAKIGSFMNSQDREIRSKYSAIWEEAYASIADELDSLYDELVRVRKTIAEKLGKKSFTSVGYARMGRTQYTKEDICIFRNGVKEKLVPVVNELFEEHKNRLGVDILYNFDEDINGAGNNLELTDTVAEDFKKIYGQLSPETDVYYKELVESGFYDLEIRQGKISGAYSNYVPLFSQPFIFETYNQTWGALLTYAHETGHGFHSFCKRGEALSFSGNCTADLAEIHSMGMEFMIWPYLNQVLKEEDVRKFKYLHMKKALSFIPYGCAVDEFQETVYDQPEMSPEERRQLWSRLEMEYQPWKNYKTDVFYKEGRAWQRQTHIYRWPFYYIDYVLAQACALQLHFMNCEDEGKGWNSYKEIIRCSGEKGFKEVLGSGGVKSPFEKGVIEELALKAAASLHNL